MQDNRKKNEGRICDAVIRLMEVETGHPRENCVWPEVNSGPDAVEILFSLGGQRYALEHTEIEPFKGQIKFDADFCRFMQPVIDEIRERGLPGTDKYRYCLFLPTNVRVNTKKAKLSLEDLQATLIKWVSSAAQELSNLPDPRGESEFYNRSHHCKTETPDGFPYRVTMRRIGRGNISEFFGVDRLPPDNDQRLERIQTAFDSKKNKLQICKILHQAQALLVLEDNDIATSSLGRIGECVIELLPRRPDWLDELFLMETFTDIEWPLYRWNWKEGHWDTDNRTCYDHKQLDDINEVAT